MGEKSRFKFIVIIALILAAAVIYSFTANLFQETPQVGLAQFDRDPDAGQTDPDAFGDMVLVEVAADTVQSVIETLDRYASYRRTILVEYFSGGESAGTLTARVAVDGGWTRADVTENSGLTEHTVIGDGNRWLWFDDGGDYVQTPAAQGAADLVQRIPTYEDVLELDQLRITAAAYELRGELPCIYVEVSQPELDYLERFWVSVESGLLVSSETLKAGELVYRMTSYEVVSPLVAPADSETELPPADVEDLFRLPDGTVLHQAGG